MRTVMVAAVLSVALWRVGVAEAADESCAAGAKAGSTCCVKDCPMKDCPTMGKFSEKDGWICLFNGKDLDGWMPRPDRKGKNCWRAENGVLVNALKRGVHGIDLVTKRKFKDCLLHIEFKVPKRGNSGVYLRGRQEVQVHDSYGQKPAMHTCGSIYGKKVADKNVSKKVGQWQCFDITFKGMTITVVHNGRKIIDSFTLKGVTGGALNAKDVGKAGPLLLQGDHTAVAYRNIWLKPLDGKRVAKGGRADQ